MADTGHVDAFGVAFPWDPSSLPIDEVFGETLTPPLRLCSGLAPIVDWESFVEPTEPAASEPSLSPSNLVSHFQSCNPGLSDGTWPERRG